LCKSEYVWHGRCKTGGTTMKTSLTLASFFSALAVPAALVVEAAGFVLPAAIDPTHAFVGFVVSLVAMLAVGDYAKSQSRSAYSTALRTVRTGKSAHPLAA
jgi:hypothetical protein